MQKCSLLSDVKAGSGADRTGQFLILEPLPCSRPWAGTGAPVVSEIGRDFAMVAVMGEWGSAQ